MVSPQAAEFAGERPGDVRSGDVPTAESDELLAISTRLGDVWVSGRHQILVILARPLQRLRFTRRLAARGGASSPLLDAARRKPRRRPAFPASLRNHSFRVTTAHPTGT